jgi:hypothetical protein
MCAALRIAIAEGISDPDWSAKIFSGIYCEADSIGGPADDMLCQVFRPVDNDAYPYVQHLFVYMRGILGPLCDFFVSGADAPAFWLDKWPALVTQARHMQAAAAQVEAAEAQCAQSRALVAFVRHGHGAHVIDEDDC